MADQNWRTEVNAQDFFGNQKKQASLDNRRPVIRKPSDLVGPGIAANAIRLDDFNDHLATYDGFFSADVGALNAPNSTDAFVGTVTSDADLGGVQTFAGLTTQAAYQRVFNRNPSDEATIYWGSWEVIGSGGTGGGVFLETLPASIINAKGDLIVGAGDNSPVIESVGDDGESLVADSTTDTGVRWDNRVKSIVPAPGSSVTVDDSDPLNPIIDVLDNGSAEWEYNDRFTITAAGVDQHPRLSYEPLPESLFVRWHPDGGAGLPILDEGFTVDGQIVTVPDPGYFAVDDYLSFQYMHNPVPPLDLSLIGSASGVFHLDNTMTFAQPVAVEEGDFIVAVVRGAVAPGGGDVTLGATSGDPRLTLLHAEVAPPVAETVFTGFITADTSDLVTLITPNPSYSSGALGVMAVFRGVNAVSDSQVGVAGVTPEIDGLGAVAITWDGNSSFTLVSSPPPTGYTDILGTGLNYSSTDVSYWFDPAGTTSPAGSYVGEGCLIIGLV